MATLEVHDGQGRVEFIELARDHPVLFGTSAACDVVLSGAAITPVHGRIRWKKGRYRVEASPDAEYVLVNGHKMTSSSLHQGDELTIGPCRMFVTHLDEDLERRPAEHQKRHPDEELTRVLEGHLHFPPAAKSTKEPTARSASTRGSPRESLFEREEWLEALATEPHAGTATERVETAPGSPVGDRHSPTKPGPGPPWAVALPFVRLAKCFRAFREERAAAPGQERIFSSPLVLGLILSLALLILLGLALRSIIVKTLANQRFDRAVAVMEDGDYRTAIRDFDDFLAAHPHDPRAGKARVLRALSNVRQYVSISGGTWTTALEAAREMYDNLNQVPEFRDERPELAELVIKIGESLADRARRSAEEKSLQEAESSVPLHAQIAGEPAPAFLKRSRLPGLLDEARAAVRKARTHALGIESMDLALRSGSASEVYKARDALIDQYADLAQDRELVQRMTRANDLIRRAVKVDPARVAAATTERPALLGPTTSLVLRSRGDAPKSPPVTEELVYAQADGLAYALDSSSGAPVWQRAVGLASPFPPLSVPGDPTVLVVDARHNELLRLEASTGKLVWRLELGEPVESPPLVQGDQLFQVLPSGKLTVIALRSGERLATANLGITLSHAPASDEQGRFLYLMGRRDCLFILSRDPLACLGVEYLGHPEGSIPCPAVRIGRFLIVVENDRPADGRWRVLVLDDDGSKVRPVQEIDVPGWTWASPAASGSVVWATGDRGGVEAFALGDYASKSPLRSLARLKPDADASGPAFGTALSERELWLAAGRSGRYELDPERGEIALRSPAGQRGPALGPVQVAGRHVVLTLQDPETGGTALWGLDPVSGAAAWQTVLGAPWPTVLVPGSEGTALRTVGQTGKEAVLSLKVLRSGGFAELPLLRPGDQRIPSGQLLALQGDGPQLDMIAPRDGSSTVWVREAAKSDAWRRLELPAAPAAMPLPWGRNLLIPGADGRAYLIDPLGAQSKAEPLVPVFNRDRRGRWRSPVHLDAASIILADDTGHVSRLGLKSEPVPHLAVEAETLLDKALIADPAATAGAVIVVTAEGRVRALSVRDLSPIGAWPLSAPLVGQPVAVGGRVFVFDGAGGVMTLGREGRRLWSIALEAPAAGSPLIQGDSVWFLDRQGRLYGRALADGAARVRLDLGILPTGGMLVVGPQPFAPVARGALAPISLDPSRTHKPSAEGTSGL
jgi:outer membrane protein assembly factor BamB